MIRFSITMIQLLPRKVEAEIEKSCTKKVFQQLEISSSSLLPYHNSSNQKITMSNKMIESDASRIQSGQVSQTPNFLLRKIQNFNSEF